MHPKQGLKSLTWSAGEDHDKHLARQAWPQEMRQSEASMSQPLTGTGTLLQTHRCILNSGKWQFLALHSAAESTAWRHSRDWSVDVHSEFRIMLHFSYSYPSRRAGMRKGPAGKKWVSINISPECRCSPVHPPPVSSPSEGEGKTFFILQVCPNVSVLSSATHQDCDIYLSDDHHSKKKLIFELFLQTSCDVQEVYRK